MGIFGIIGNNCSNTLQNTKTVLQSLKYIKNKYNASTRIVYKLLTGEPFVVSTRSRNTLSELEGAVAYRKKLL